MAKKTAKATSKTQKAKTTVKVTTKTAKAKVPAKTKAKATAKLQAKVSKTPKKIQDLAKKAAAKKAPVKQTPVKASVKKPVVSKNVPMAPAASKRPANDVAVKVPGLDFSSGDYVVYPAHGVGQVEGIETQTIGGMEVKLYAVSFEKDRMRLKIPVFKAKTSGLRKVCGGEHLDNALKTLKGRSRIKRMMWSRRAQEYEMKINSGDPVAIAEVLRDLKRSNDDTEQSYSERQIYQSALERLAREVAIVEKMSEEKAADHIEKLMGKKKPANDRKAA